MNLSVNVSRALELYEKSEYSEAVSDFLSPGEKIEVPAMKVPSFKPGKPLKEAMKNA